jgi:hypothetical protein
MHRKAQTTAIAVSYREDLQRGGAPISVVQKFKSVVLPYLLHVAAVGTAHCILNQHFIAPDD